MVLIQQIFYSNKALKALCTGDCLLQKNLDAIHLILVREQSGQRGQ